MSDVIMKRHKLWVEMSSKTRTIQSWPCQMCELILIGRWSNDKSGSWKCRFRFLQFRVEAGLRQPQSQYNTDSYECERISVESVVEIDYINPNTQFDCATKFLCIIKLVALDVKWNEARRWQHHATESLALSTKRDRKNTSHDRCVVYSDECSTNFRFLFFSTNNQFSPLSTFSSSSSVWLLNPIHCVDRKRIDRIESGHKAVDQPMPPVCRPTRIVHRES